MKNDYQYRKGTIKDLEKIRDLTTLAYSQFKTVLGETHWSTMEGNLIKDETYLQLFKTAQCFVCEYGDTIVGSVFVVRHGHPTAFFLAEWSYIRLLGIHPEHEGKGIGRKLTKLCMAHAKETGEQTIALHTSEFQNAARHIYESIGFKKLKDLDRIYNKQFYLYTFTFNHPL